MSHFLFFFLVRQAEESRRAAVDLTNRLRAQEQELENSRNLEHDRCVVCQENSPTHMFDTCNQLCICDTCLRVYREIPNVVNRWTQKVKCPSCNLFGKVVRVYISRF